MTNMNLFNLKLTCFIKFKKCKYDITLQDHVEEELLDSHGVIRFTRFGHLYDKIAQVFLVAHQEQLDTRIHLFEVSVLLVINQTDLFQIKTLDLFNKAIRGLFFPEK